MPAAALLGALLLAAPAAADPYAIRLLTGELTPQPGLSESEAGALAARAAAAVERGEGRLHLLLQLWEPPDFAQRQRLWSEGIDLGAYVPGSAWIASVPAVEVAAVLGRREVRWAAPWDAPKKIHPRLRAPDRSPWAVDPARPGWVMILLQLHHDVALERGAELAAAYGGVALPPVRGLHGLTVWLPAARIRELAAAEEVLWIEEGPPPLSPTNDGLRRQGRVDPLAGEPYGLDGSGVTVFVYDGGSVLAEHTTFDDGGGGRVTLLDPEVPPLTHSTHVAGTVGGDGNGTRAAGMAPGVSLLSAAYQQLRGPTPFWETAGDIEADYARARNGFGADLGNNSIGSNTATNGYPCDLEGDYGSAANLIDGIARGDNPEVDGPVLLVWANGNDRAGGIPRGRCGANYRTTPPPSCAKNPIHVGAVNSDGGSMTIFGSWGPCDDGRLKPEVSAGGCETGRLSGEFGVYSSIAITPEAFGGLCGTSMAAPAVSGMAALLIQEWRRLGYGDTADRPLPALVKALLIHTVRDLGPAGPDYRHGYGEVRAQQAVDFLRWGGPLGSGAPLAWGADEVSHGEVDTFLLTVPPGAGRLQATLAWDDPAAALFAATALVNDLDLELVAPDGEVVLPWVLDPELPQAPAAAGVNRLDNHEQVLVEGPEPGVWLLRVVGGSVPVGPQTYGLAYGVRRAIDASRGCAAAVADGGFEAGTDGWALEGAAARVPAPVPGHGAFSLQLGGAVNQTDTAWLEVAIPEDATRAVLSYAWSMVTEEEAGFGHGWDHFLAEVRDPSGEVLIVFDRRNDGEPQGQWLRQENMDLTPWAGRRIRIAFFSTNEGSLPTTFWIDDVALDLCRGEADPNPEGFPWWEEDQMWIGALP